MERYMNRLLRALEGQLAKIALSHEGAREQSKRSIVASQKAMAKLRGYTLHCGFEGTAEEIYFYKQVKPQFYSKLIYYVQAYKYYVNLPPLGEAVLQEYIRSQLAELMKFFERNRAYYHYHRSGRTDLDEVYYTRQQLPAPVELDDFERDPRTSAGREYKLAKLLANERFRDFLMREQAKIENPDLEALSGQKLFPFTHPAWTASQTDLVELIYALKCSGAVNHGNIDISELAAIFEFIFQAELHETYHKLLDITRRKKDRFVFLSRLIKSLGNFIDEKFA